MFDQYLYGSRRRRLTRRAQAVGIFAGGFAFIWAVLGWATMVAVGNVHAWWSHIPSMSYFTALGVNFPTLVGILIITLFAEWIKP